MIQNSHQPSGPAEPSGPVESSIEASLRITAEIANLFTHSTKLYVSRGGI